MPVDPISIIGEILGQPAESMRNPVNAGYECPFINNVCTKRGHLTDGSYPVCSVWGNVKSPRLVCVCPKRFYGADLQTDVLENAWFGEKPKNLRVAYEVKMEGFGNVDFVLADVNPETHSVNNFVSVEIQAVDITGSVSDAYLKTTNSQMLDRRPQFGFNWANVRKRYISQLISKGFFHHQWGTRMAAVLQEPLYEKFREYITFDEMNPTKECNIIFLLYDYTSREENGFPLKLSRVIGTSHNSLMLGTLYRKTPDRSRFCERILANIYKSS